MKMKIKNGDKFLAVASGILSVGLLLAAFVVALEKDEAVTFGQPSPEVMAAQERHARETRAEEFEAAIKRGEHIEVVAP